MRNSLYNHFKKEYKLVISMLSIQIKMYRKNIGMKYNKMCTVIISEQYPSVTGNFDFFKVCTYFSKFL